MTRKEKVLQVIKTFEPNRLADNHLMDAYDLLIPPIKHVLKTDKKLIQKNQQKIKGNK